MIASQFPDGGLKYICGSPTSDEEVSRRYRSRETIRTREMNLVRKTGGKRAEPVALINDQSRRGDAMKHVEETCSECGKTISRRARANVYHGLRVVCTSCLHKLEAKDQHQE